MPGRRLHMMRSGHGLVSSCLEHEGEGRGYLGDAWTWFTRGGREEEAAGGPRFAFPRLP